METPELVKQICIQLVDRLSTKLGSSGYQLVHQQNDDHAYGSCITIWSNNEDALRLTWDGKENWFLLEEAPLPLSAIMPWAEIIVSPFDPDEHDMVYAKTIIQDVMDSLD